MSAKRAKKRFHARVEFRILPIMVPAKHAAWSAMARRTAEPPISWLMRMALEHPKLISLAAGFTDSESLPIAEARELLHEILSSRATARSALQYGFTPGEPLLRRLTAERVRRLDGLEADLDRTGQTIITNGSQQLLYLLTECLCDSGDIVLVEDPTYFVFLGITQSRGVICRGVSMEHDGVDLRALERVLHELRRRGALARVKFIYLITYFQNPSGVTTSFEKKRAVLELLRRYEGAAGHPIYLVEDTAYRELGFTPDVLPKSALAAPKSLDRVIYSGTYSKPFATGARVGFGLLPSALFPVVTRLKSNHDFGTSTLLQHLLARALASGIYDRHLPVLRKRYAAKAAIMTRAARAHLPAGVCWAEPRGGLYVWARLPEGMKAGIRSRLFKAALARDLLYVPGELCYADDATRARPTHEMRLSFGGAADADIREGIQRLGTVMKEIRE